MGDLQELCVELEATKAVTVVTRKATKKGVDLLKKAELDNKTLQAKVRQLELENAFLSSAKAKVEENGTQLKLDLKQSQPNFVKRKKKLKVAYQK